MFRRFLQRPKLPQRLVMLLTNPRSGSTWLFDALRAHPAVYMLPEAAVFTYFGMTGRRYPRDLAGGDPAHAVQIEVQPGIWEALPGFVLPKSIAVAPLPTYALEKCHPHFFKHDVDGFVHKLNALSPRTQVRMIYQVRDPDESLLSFLRYKARNPDWNPHIGQEQLPAHMRRIYESLLRCAQAYPGVIVDYASLETNFQATLGTIFADLWQQGATTELIAAIASITQRENRAATSFLGQRTTDVSEDKAHYAAMFQQHAADIDACHTAYHGLMRLRREGTV